MPSNSLARETTGSVERERSRIVGRHFKQKPLRPAGTSTGNKVLQQHAGNAVAAPGGRDAKRQDLAFGSETLIEQHAARRAILGIADAAIGARHCQHRRQRRGIPRIIGKALGVQLGDAQQIGRARRLQNKAHGATGAACRRGMVVSGARK